MVKPRFSNRLTKLCLWGLGLTLLHLQLQLYWSLAVNHSNAPSSTTNHHATREQQQQQSLADCAINIFGLPRAFHSIVLPSMKRHVIPQNPNCDYYVHAYNLTLEQVSRSGQGGNVNVEEILELADAVHQFHPHARVHFAWTQEADFWERHRVLMHKIHTTKRVDGEYRYFPSKATSYKFPSTVDNIIKMWHSIESVFHLMQKHALHKNQYTRVAMIRSDVMYMTPIHVHPTNKDPSMKNSSTTVIPGFGRFPVSDRLIVGPIQAVEPWAIHRFDHLEKHVQFMEQQPKLSGFVMHSERFVKFTLLPLVSQKGRYPVVEHDSMCFFRARADESVWVTDCFIGNPQATIAPPLFNMTANERLTPERLIRIRSKIESILERRCYPGNWSKPNKRGIHLAMSCGSMPSS